MSGLFDMHDMKYKCVLMLEYKSPISWLLYFPIVNNNSHWLHMNYGICSQAYSSFQPLISKGSCVSQSTFTPADRYADSGNNGKVGKPLWGQEGSGARRHKRAGQHEGSPLFFMSETDSLINCFSFLSNQLSLACQVKTAFFYILYGPMSVTNDLLSPIS